MGIMTNIHNVISCIVPKLRRGKRYQEIIINNKSVFCRLVVFIVAICVRKEILFGKWFLVNCRSFHLLEIKQDVRHKYEVKLEENRISDHL